MCVNRLAAICRVRAAFLCLRRWVGMAKPIAPMEALLAAELPDGDGWQYEPKWDGFRAVAVRDGDDLRLISRSGKDLGRYFPEILAMLAGLKERNFTLDGELIIPIGDALSFEALQLRLHPAASRIERLSRETPAEYMLFDTLGLGSSLCEDQPLSKRRKTLESFYRKQSVPGLLLSPATTDRDTAIDWLKRSGGALDGVIAKRLDQPYAFGERTMIHVKQQRTADCIVGGFRYAEKATEVGRCWSASTTKRGSPQLGFTPGSCRGPSGLPASQKWRGPVRGNPGGNAARRSH